MGDNWKDIATEGNWKEFKGEYEKTFYDVKLPTGEVVKHCWPNAGSICSMDGSGRIFGEGVIYRKSTTHPLDEE